MSRLSNAAPSTIEYHLQQIFDELYGLVGDDPDGQAVVSDLLSGIDLEVEWENYVGD